MLHRLRESCGLSAVKLGDVVEIDETYLEYETHDPLC